MATIVENKLQLTTSTRIKKRKGYQYATRSRDSLSRKRCCTDDKKSGKTKVYDYMDLQPEITAESRADMIKWIIYVHIDYKLFNETLYLTINIIDRFLAAEVVRETELRAVGITAMFIASKYIEVRRSAHGFIDDVSSGFMEDVFTSPDPDYERQRNCILKTEKRILIRLDGRLSVPTLYTFIMNAIEAVEKPLETKVKNMVYFYAELGMMNYEIISRFDPSMVAASAIYGACAALNKIELYKLLEKQNGFKDIPVLECARMIGVSHSRARTDEMLKAVYEKYSSETRDEVAFYPPASFLLIPAFTLTQKICMKDKMK